MARKTTASGKLENRTQRAKLPAQRNPHWALVAPLTHLGYRPPAVKGRQGTWIARRAVVRPGERMRYREEALGAADDHPDSVVDGAAVRTFHQAVAAAREWSATQAAADRARASGAADVKVRDAVAAYVAMRRARSAASGRDAEQRLTRHVLSATIADLSLADLTDHRLATWRASLRQRQRGRKGDPLALAPATLARLLADLRAALSAAARKAKLPGDVLATIRDGLCAPDAPDRPREAQILTDDDVRRIVEASFDKDADLGALVLVLAATGCRFDQAARLTVADLQIGNRRILIPTSLKGRGAKPQTHIAVPLADDALARLGPLVVGRRGHERLLLRWHHRQKAGDRPAGRLPDWERVERRPWRTPSEMARPWHAVLSAAKLPGDFVPYALRHSSIVRGLRAGLPVRLVAAAHDTSVAMIERTYAAYIVDASEDLLRRATVPLTGATVAPLRIVGRKTAGA